MYVVVVVCGCGGGVWMWWWWVVDVVGCGCGGGVDPHFCLLVGSDPSCLWQVACRNVLTHESLFDHCAFVGITLIFNWLINISLPADEVKYSRTQQHLLLARNNDRTESLELDRHSN